MFLIKSKWNKTENENTQILWSPFSDWRMIQLHWEFHKKSIMQIDMSARTDNQIQSICSRTNVFYESPGQRLSSNQSHHNHSTTRHHPI